MSNKKIEDYLHLYLGCKAITSLSPEVITMEARHLEVAIANKWKPLLRPLSVKAEKLYTAEQIRHLLSTQVDLFGLIEAGLAIDKTKVEK